MDLEALKTKAKAHWTAERLAKLTAGKKLLVLPTEAAGLLYTCGILNKDASISADSTRKFLQINHMLQLLKPTIDDLVARHKIIRIADLACGNSYLALLLAWYLTEIQKVSALIVGIDSNPAVVKNSAMRAATLGLDKVCEFRHLDLKDLSAGDLFAANGDDATASNVRPNLVIALHACDIATDLALAAAVKSQADHFAVAPCCQAELARKWTEATWDKSHPHYPLFHAPNLRRETAAQYTDLMRMLLTRAHGYEVTATEFTASRHTNKNRLLVGSRRGRFLAEAQEQYQRLKSSMGEQGVALEELLSP